MRKVFILMSALMTVFSLTACSGINHGETGLAELLITPEPYCWHGNYSVGSCVNDVYVFYEDGTYGFEISAYESSARMRCSSGDWWLEEDVLCLSTEYMLLIEGGELVPGLYEDQIENGTFVVRKLEENERVVERYPIILLEDDDSGFPSIQVGDTVFWKMDGIAPIVLWDFHDTHEPPPKFS